MEAILVLLVLGIWIVIKLSISDLRTTFEKEKDAMSVGIRLFDNKMYDKAIQFFDQHVEMDNPPLSCFLYLARCHFQLGNYHQAYWNYTRVVNRENIHSRVFFERGEVLRLLNEMDLALLDYNKAIWFERNNEEYYFQRGLLQLALKMKNEAKEDFIKAKNLGSENANFYLLQPLLFSDII
jgi:tetratricopeptide (TPR) repeat protein